MKSIEESIHIKSSPQAILSAFTNPLLIKELWNSNIFLMDLKPGGLYSLIAKTQMGKLGFIITGTIKSYVPEKALVFENLVYLAPDKPFLGPIRLTIEVLRQKKTNTLHIIEDGYDTGPRWDLLYEHAKHTWPLIIQQLKRHLESTAAPYERTLFNQQIMN